LINTATYDTEALLRLLAEDNPKAFTELYNRFWQKLFAIAYNRLKNKEAAEDVVHDVFASLWANRHKVDIAQLENYLATATRYMVLGQIKKQILHRRYVESKVELPIISFDIANALHFKNILEQVKIAANELPEKCRLVFKYSREEGLPVKEIARIMHIAPKTVENQLAKALKHLKLATKNFLLSLPLVLALWITF
jgi:RNA polymerase sigma-70 factor (family 1)